MTESTRGLFIKILDSLLTVHLSNVSHMWSVGSVKVEIQMKMGHSWDIIDLHYGEQILEDTKLVSCYGVEDGGTIIMTIRDGIGIMTLGGKRIRIREARQDWTVKQLKSAVSEATGIPEISVQLMYMNGMLFANNRTLRSYNINPEIDVILTHRPDGGAV